MVLRCRFDRLAFVLCQASHTITMTAEKWCLPTKDKVSERAFPTAVGAHG